MASSSLFLISFLGQGIRSDLPRQLGNSLDLPCAARAPPVMLWVISLRPGFMFNILAGVV
jgi:hypothetical protein